ncbi:MAG: thermonuclease family protein [Chlorobiaceae bacterium]|nr:thermonuclease family protein [Chlorobiaceae bacterium]
MPALISRIKLHFFILPIILLMFAACQDAPDSGRVIRVADGDTITILHNDNKQEKIRLYGIDAPEKSQPFGRKARKYTSSLVFGKQVLIRTMDRDRYGRNVAWVYVGEKNINAELVKAGYAWHYRKYSNDRQLQQLEEEARNARRGLWRDAKPVPPWKYRVKKRN